MTLMLQDLLFKINPTELLTVHTLPQTNLDMENPWQPTINVENFPNIVVFRAYVSSPRVISQLSLSLNISFIYYIYII